MSSHREAPAISKDPVADSTDLYAFVSPDAPDTVTVIANYIPFEGPAGGPNFYEFGDDVLYEIKIDNDADTEAEIIYRFRFATSLPNTNTFLYNTGPIDSLDSPNWNRRQFYSVVRVVNGKATVLGQHLACPPVNIGPRSTPEYASLAAAAVHTLPGGIKVFAGQRRDGFFVDLGSIFDLGDLRPFQNLHLIPTMAAPGVDATKATNVHSIAIQIPKAQLTRDGMNPTNVANTRSVIGVWTSASRRKAQIRDRDTQTESGPWVQVSRLGNPLFNEVIVPMAHKDRWNSLQPSGDSEFSGYVAHPELAGLLPVLYPGVFPNLAAYTKARADLEAILLTGIPSGVVPGFQNYTRSNQADMLRLNLAIPPSTSPNPIGLIAGDAAGFPNGRRVFDDTVAIELRAVAGATIPLVDPSFTPDGAAALLKDGTAPASDRYMSEFPYLGVPLDGYDTPSS
ncbi:MAG: DUF4331 domain-containing protein [Candidatus Limnocylindrales bacterium]